MMNKNLINLNNEECEYMNNDIKSMYIHIPFCKHICSYCDFCKMFYNEELVNKYLEELQKEVLSKYKGEELDTLYIGGGTPSALNLSQLGKLFEIIKTLNLSSHLEFSFEMNVVDINEEILIFLKNNKVNRISIGIETVNDKFLSLLERNHTKDEVLDKIEMIKKYFNNINVDFMYAFPNQTMDDLKSDLEFFKKLNVSHISIYSLILEENTKLYINGTEPIDDILESNMYYYIIKYLKNIGYNHYEISNFSKEGYSSRHNLTYWNNEKYYGFGLGAGGYVAGVRYSNTRSINHYLKGDYCLEKDNITKKIDMENEMILGLRKMEGVSTIKFFDKYQVNIKDVFKINDLLDKGILKVKNNYIYIAEEYLYLSNQILTRFIDI